MKYNFVNLHVFLRKLISVVSIVIMLFILLSGPSYACSGGRRVVEGATCRTAACNSNYHQAVVDYIQGSNVCKQIEYFSDNRCNNSTGNPCPTSCSSDAQCNGGTCANGNQTSTALCDQGSRGPNPWWCMGLHCGWDCHTNNYTCSERTRLGGGTGPYGSQGSCQSNCQMPNCTTGGSCTSCSAPYNTCGNNNGTLQCTYTQPQVCRNTTKTFSCTINNCDAGSGYACTGGTCTTSISGKVFIDYNNNGAIDGGDDPKVNYQVAINGNGVNTTTQTDGNGNYIFPNLSSGTYTLSVVVPPNYIASTPNPHTVNLGPQATNINFGLAPLYSISGNIYVDIDKDPSDTKYDGTDILYTLGRSNITFNGQSFPSSNTNTGIYSSGVTLPAGTYTVSFSNFPSGAYLTSYPNNGPPPSFSITIGKPGKNPSCSTNPYTTGSCDPNGNINGLNFGIAFGNPWLQATCGDMRFDSGLQDSIPASPSCGGTSGPYAIYKNASCSNLSSVFFSGDSSSSFGKGLVSQSGWIAGGNLINPDTYPRNTGELQTSYNYIQATTKKSGITPADISKYCQPSKQISSCTLSNSIPHGVYIANGDLHIQGGFNIPNDNNYIILVNGKLYIQGDIVVPITGSGSSITFSSRDDIHIDPSVKNLQGFYSTDTNFIADTATGGTCVSGVGDTQLNVQGSVIVNAALKGGSFTYKRDLCPGNLDCPAITFTARPDLILHAPQFLRNTHSIFREVAP